MSVNAITVKDVFGVKRAVTAQPVGCIRNIIFDNFHNFDSGVDGDWEIVQTGSGMTISGPLGGAVAGSSPYLNIASGVTAAQKTILLSRSAICIPFDFRYQITASQRIANNHCMVGLVEVDVKGNILTSDTYATVNEVLGAKNAVFLQHDGVTATTAQLKVRAAGSALDTFANAFGTGFTTVATGSTPNFLAATTHGITVDQERILTRTWGQNLLTNTGGQFAYDRLALKSNAFYKLCIIVENVGAPASTTDWRIHMVSATDLSLLSVSPRAAGTTDQSRAFPVIVNSLPTLAAVTTVSTVSAVTSAGTPAAPATPYILNSLASTNEVLILTGTSGLQAFYATNTGATEAFVKLYNKATAPTSADVPAMIIPVPAAVSGVPGVATLPIGFNGFRFALGLGIRITGAVADNDTTAVAAGQVKVMLSRTV